MHLKRVISAVIFLPLFYLWIQYLPPVAFFVLVLIGVFLGQWEFYRLHYPVGKQGLLLFGLLWGGVILWHFYRPGYFLDREVLTVAIGAVLLFQLAFQKNLAASVTDASVALLGALYVAWFLGHLILIRNLEQGIALIFFLFFVTWAGDTGAYYVGKSLGRRPLAPRISPNKTVEGAIGGWAASVLAAGLAQWWFLPVLSMTDCVLLGAVLGLVGQLGDLTESMFKRGSGIKDSGHFLPGHGGILDKLDSLIFTTPVFYYYLIWIKQYGRLIVI